MEQLPAELILHITRFLPVRSITNLNLVSKHLHNITRDDGLWKYLSFSGSYSDAARNRNDILSNSTPIPVQEPTVFELQRAVARSSTALSNGNYTDGTRTKDEIRTARAMANWDPTYLGEKVDWYSEYVARHAPVSISWLQQPESTFDGSKEKLEIRGMGLFNDRDKHMVVAPLDDGSFCLWDVGQDDGSKAGRVVGRSRPGLLSFDNGKTGGVWQSSASLRIRMPGSGVVECVSVDKGRNKAYVAVQHGLHEVDLSTLQLTAFELYPNPISTLSPATSPTPLTIGTPQTLHIHDPRTGRNSASPCTPLSPFSNPDFHRLHTSDPSTAFLSQPLPLSIVHHPPNTIHVAGRFPSILTYDRRSFPSLHSSIHSGARLSTLCALPSPTPTLAAAGEYNGKGSLELYPLPSTQHPAPFPARKNRASASRSKLLSLTPHGTRLLISDSDGALKWLERDGCTLVRKWNINTFISTSPTASSLRDQPRVICRGLFSAAPEEGDVALKLLPLHPPDSDNAGRGDEEVAVWTGEKIGVLSFRQAARFDTPAEGKGGGGGDGEDYARVMRRALERQADEVRFVRGLGMGGG